ncbi:hypothetical protein TTHERM_00637840 (macronuclear) [Tetrahymena thermophila SB210]|uniref:Bowman-birk serine protease inhibitor family protein n=1 Tax=Tetrahymena thermophila (strain SB210) TaxID=312017 RepID=Q22HB9_TETTS|nr:hypothetical protein TTHERM_00637840 [Tetrahymena thermophila SB210]EAR84782.2 hypothetical protein TTHERM_00637840 [Tetrahymena thermophila SB210]|eukprot:XP_001032445.2 hypothetical protein TTHERM_00637840 [Tetrahymena thermophila SB210]
MKTKIFILIFSMLNKAILSYQPNQDFQIYQSTQDTFLPCQQLPNNQSKILSFQQLFPNINIASRIVLSVKYIPYGNILKEYTIISIHQLNNLIVSISYNLLQNKIFLSFNGQTQEYLNPIISYSKQVQINLDIQTEPGWIKAQIAIQSTGGNSQTYPQIIQSYNQQLSLSQLELNYGNPSQRFNLNPSCSIFQNLSIGISNSPTSLTFDEVVDYLNSNTNQISQSYDFFYTQNNPGELISEIGTFQQVLSKPFLNSVISTGNSLETIYFDLPDNQFTISFFLKFLQPLPSTQSYICINFDFTSFWIYFRSNQIFIGSKLLAYNPLVWNNIIIAKSKSILGGTLRLFINDSQYDEIPYNSNHYRFQIMFFSNDVQYELNHIRIYSGSILYQTNNCFLQSSDGLCLICMSNYLLDFQNNMQCIPKNMVNTDNYIRGVKDWNPPRKLCPKNMINDYTSSSGCKCLIGYYLEGGNCIQCPSYCRNCNSLSDCSSERDSLERSNIRIPNYSDYGSLCSNMDPDINKYILPSSQLNLKATDSIFFSFSIQVQSFLLLPLQEIRIAYIQESLKLLFYDENKAVQLL